MTSFVITFFIVLGAYLLVLVGLAIYKRVKNRKDHKAKDKQVSDEDVKDKQDD